MSAVSKIERVLATELLERTLVRLPGRGATESELNVTESALGALIPEVYKILLRRWDGLQLEVIRFFGSQWAPREIGRITELQLDQLPGLVAFGSDPAGLVYLFNDSGAVITYDPDENSLERTADSFDDFVERVVFGADGASFAGDDWLDELRENGLIED